eukprot:94529-Prymnesium_polylepis.1
MQLESGAYRSVRSACDVGALLLGVLGPDGTVYGEAPTAHVDETVLLVVLEEAVSNARKYRAEGTPILARAALEGSELHVALENVNTTGVQLSDDELVSAFTRGWRGAHAAISSS